MSDIVKNNQNDTNNMIYNPTDDPMEMDFVPIYNPTDDIEEFEQTIDDYKDNDHANNISSTFMDEIENDNNLAAVYNWCNEQEYDSDALYQDLIIEDKYSSNIYQTFPNKYSLIEQKQSDYNQQSQTKLFVVLTFDFAFNLNPNLSYLNKTKIRSIDEFGKVDYFEQFIKAFLESDKHKYQNLLLDYQHKQNEERGIDHLIHIKHIILSLINKYGDKNSNKKIILICHLNRDKNLSQQFPLIIQKSHKILYLDSLSQQIPFDLNTFVNQTVSDFCKSKGIQLICSNNIFQRALANLNFHHNNNIHIETENDNLSKIFSTNCQQNKIDIQHCLFERFIHLLSEPDINMNISEIVCIQSIMIKIGQRDHFMND